MVLFGGVSQGDLGTLALGLVIAGVVGGLVQGMLGVGGGIVVVPILYHVMAGIGVDPSLRMQLAIASTLAALIPISFATAMAANGKGAIDWPLLRRCWLPLLVGALAGSALSSWLAGRTLTLLFALLALPLAVLLAVWNERKRLREQPPGGTAGTAVAFAIGSVSTLMGLGGGTVGVPALSLCGFSFERALGTAGAFGVIISVIGTVAAVLTGFYAGGLPAFSLGYVNFAAALLLAPTLLLATKAGAALAPVIDRDRLGKVLALFVAVAAARLLWDALV